MGTMVKNRHSAQAGQSGPARQLPVAGQPVARHAAALLAWYERHARPLPWRVGPAARRRGVRPDPYRVWLSEIMLQQTVAKAVVPYFAAFTARWPDVASLAAAADGEVMAAWAGLGYYARARNLIACARIVRDDHGGRFPETAAALAALPGIGAYTSAAIAAIAFDERVAAVDGNVERVVARLDGIATPLPKGKAEIRAAIESMVPEADAGAFAEAMMDLGATICTPKRPTCPRCPLAGRCRARAAGTQLAFPVRAAKPRRPLRRGHAYVALTGDGRVLLRRRPENGLLGGMMEVPGSAWTEAPEAGAGAGDAGAAAGVSDAGAAAPFAARWRQLSAPVEHGFTHFRLELAVHVAHLPAGRCAPEGAIWHPVATLAEAGLPRVMQKVVEAALAAME